MYDLNRYGLLIHPRRAHPVWRSTMGPCKTVCPPLNQAERSRIDVGGKLLTNHLKHLISFRQWNMIDQTAIVDAVRETCGYVSMDYKQELDICK
jgi:hypothetical protein